ncbi:hypothetical protein Agabi119p4_11431 [Agaricus bisporus var. burnettii]|uniref:Transmembrane protein n=1 Tax=Agaricus bisporus var. burnettii TaxID=192524 RepID=A0A8H7BYH9_AGABI|nr:hypothetical protein Agabi119p4_11431 [Agaricus bisporus var. burnettii]
MATRKIVYDDQDSNIQYSGEWSRKTGDLEDIGNFGSPYLHTLHGTNHDAKISLEFDGTGIEVFGTNIVNNPTTDPDPNFECFIDGVSIGRDSPFTFQENNWKLCETDGLFAGQHKLHIDIKVKSRKQTFWLDKIQYVPSPSVPLDNKTIQMANKDSAIRLDTTWRRLGPFKVTSVMNAVAYIDFNGTSVSWVGYIPSEFPRRSAFGTYSIDDSKPTNFSLSGLPENKGTSEFNQVFFATPEVENGPHTLTVTFLGSKDTTLLTLDCLYIKGSALSISPSNTISVSSTIPSPSTNSGSSAIFNPTTTAIDSGSDSARKPELNIDALLGGIIGVLGLLIIIAGTILCRRRRQSFRRNGVQAFRGEPTSMSVNPYSGFRPNVGPDNATVTPLQPPVPSMKAQETYIDAPVPSRHLPVKFWSAKWREAFGYVPRTTDTSGARSWSDGFGPSSWRHSVSSGTGNGQQHYG